MRKPGTLPAAMSSHDVDALVLSDRANALMKLDRAFRCGQSDFDRVQEIQILQIAFLV